MKSKKEELWNKIQENLYVLPDRDLYKLIRQHEDFLNITALWQQPLILTLARVGKLDLVGKLIKDGANTTWAPHIFHETLFQFACATANKNLIKILLKNNFADQDNLFPDVNTSILSLNNSDVKFTKFALDAIKYIAHEQQKNYYYFDINHIFFQLKSIAQELDYDINLQLDIENFEQTELNDFCFPPIYNDPVFVNEPYFQELVFEETQHDNNNIIISTHTDEKCIHLDTGSLITIESSGSLPRDCFIIAKQSGVGNIIALQEWTVLKAGTQIDCGIGVKTLKEDVDGPATIFITSERNLEVHKNNNVIDEFEDLNCSFNNNVINSFGGLNYSFNNISFNKNIIEQIYNEPQITMQPKLIILPHIPVQIIPFTPVHIENVYSASKKNLAPENIDKLHIVKPGLKEKMFEVTEQKIKTTFKLGVFVLTTHTFGNEVLTDPKSNTHDVKAKSKTYFNNGQIYYCHNNQIADTESSTYVISRKGDLYIGGAHHSYMIKGTEVDSQKSYDPNSFKWTYGFGKPIACGGHLTIQNGKITTINNDSGHYTPTSDQLKLACKYLEDNNVLACTPTSHWDNNKNNFVENIDLAGVSIDGILSKYNELI